MNFIPPNKDGVPLISKPSGDSQRSIPHFKTTQPMLEYTVLETRIPAKKSGLKCKENFYLKDTLDVSTTFTSIIANDSSTPQSNVIKSGTLKDTFSVGQAKPETGQGGGKHAPAPKLVNEQTPDHPDSSSLVISDSPSSGKEVVQFLRRTIDRSRQKHRCSTCSSTFNTERAYTRHMTSEHNQKKTHICSFCEKGFQDKFDLKRHYRTHTGVRPYKCNICPRTFTQRCSLETHISKVHGMPLTFGFKERRKKIYVCEDCGNSAKDAYDHYLHMWISHSRLTMPKRLRYKVMHKIKKSSQDGGVKSEEQLLADDMVVTQAIRCLRDLVQSQG
nr:transcription factor Ovo-like 2 [Lytechinus pictus]